MSSSSSSVVPSATARRTLDIGLPEVLVERERRRLPTRILADDADLVELVLRHMLIGDHHEEEEFDDRLVLAIRGRVNGDVAVEVAQLLVHLAQQPSQGAARRGDAGNRVDAATCSRRTTS
jgi:hypothetical protein